jgi:hypothetical protein
LIGICVAQHLSKYQQFPDAVGSRVVLWLNLLCISPLTQNAMEFPAKSHLITLFLALVFGFVGGKSSQIFQSNPSAADEWIPQRHGVTADPLAKEPDTENFALQIEQMQKKIALLEAQLNRAVRNEEISPVTVQNTVQEPVGETALLSAEVSDTDYLAAIGVDPEVASEILRRISQQQFRTMELRNLMRTGDSSEQQRYMEELRELNRNRISLRTELGDEKYDQYLFVSGKNNRVRVNSVMAGSPAEAYGVQPGDIILNYNDRSIIDVRDLQSAALSGDNGSYSNVEILRDGNRLNLMLPAGTMGVQLEATRVDPKQ